MFDIGFWELALIGVVALLVVGPERLPGLARTAGVWVRKVRRFVGSVKADIEQELRAEELKSLLDEGRQFRDVGQTLDQARASLDEAHRELSASATEVPPSATTAQPNKSPASVPGESRSDGPSADGTERAPSAQAAIERDSDKATKASVVPEAVDPKRKNGG